MRLAYVHPMKTAGSYVSGYLVTNVFRPRGYEVFVSEHGRDYEPNELRRILRTAGPDVYVHNHLGGWTEELVEEYRAAGFFMFTFARHPGDQWCSFYHWAHAKPGNFTRRLTLDRFLTRGWSDTPNMDFLRRNLDLPAWWRTLDLAAPFTPDTFAAFLVTMFGAAYAETSAQNTSSNRGFDVHRGEGVVSESTERLLHRTARWSRWCEIAGLPLPADSQDERAAAPAPTTAPRSQPGIRSPRGARGRRAAIVDVDHAPPTPSADRSDRITAPADFVIVFRGSAGSTWLVELMRQHPRIRVAGESFALGGKLTTQAAQDRHLRELWQTPEPLARGFKVKPQQITDLEAFARAIDEHAVRVVHLHRANIVKHAVSQLRKKQQADLIERMLGSRSGRLDSAWVDENPEIVLGSSEIDPGKLLKMVRKLEREWIFDTSYVSRFPYALQLTYEALLSRPVETLSELSEFLGVGAHEWDLSAATTMKVTSDDLSDSITNFSELLERFSDRPEYQRMLLER